jgi:predicted ATP-binding protein involved in virulence
MGMFLGRFAGCTLDPQLAIVNPLETNSNSIRHGSDFVGALISYMVDIPVESRLNDSLQHRAIGLNPFDSTLLEYASTHLAPFIQDKNANLPLLFHYPAEGYLALRRGVPSVVAETSDESATIRPQTRAYTRSLEADAVGQFQTFLKWFRAQEDIENQTRLRKDMSFRSKQLDPVRVAIEGFLQALPGNANFRNLRVEREAVEKESAIFKISERISFVIDKDQETFDLAQLSDGERSTLLLVADIAMRLVIANPAQQNPLLGTGIVLIDEIERHLHPAWQRAILGGLAATFPNIQFIVTTHSPQVLSRVPRESVFLLDRFQLVSTPHTYGRDSNAILEDVMGVSERPEEALGKIRDIGRLLDMDQIESARQKLSELEEWFGEGDTEISRLRRLIDFAS